MQFSLLILFLKMYLILHIVGCGVNEEDGSNNTSSKKKLELHGLYLIGKVSYKDSEQSEYDKVSDYKLSRGFEKGNIIKIDIDLKHSDSTRIVINFNHNLLKEDIIQDTISTKFVPYRNRLGIMSIEFVINRDTKIELFSTLLSTGLTTLCSNRGKDDVKIFGLNSSFEKENLYETGYGQTTVFGDNKYDAYFDLREINEKYVLVECYEYSEIKYRAIFNLDRYEFWNYSNHGTIKYDKTLEHLPKFRVSYLTDLYFRGYEIYLDKGLTEEEAKKKARIKVKNIFPNYPFEEIGFHSSNDIKSNIIENYMDVIDKKFSSIEEEHDYTTEYILNELEKYLFLDNSGINENIKSAFPISNVS